jgi:hypothetical protein
VVSVGEIKSIALRNRWGINKTSQLIKILAQLIIADINVEDVVNRYAEIEAFSQNKLAGKPLPVTARNWVKMIYG